MSIPFKPGDILIPKNINMNKWSVVACDQYTSEPKYWKEVSDYVGNDPSTLNLILPEVYLEETNVDERIKRINENMQDYLDSNIFNEYKDSMIYVSREQSDGRIRDGLIGVVDLEDYSFDNNSQSLIRATEKTVIERIPPRVKVRENALLELPHIMILIDDDKREIIESLKDKINDKDKLYDFDLMMNGGHIKGYRLGDKFIQEVNKKLELLSDNNYFEDKYDVKNKGVLLFAMGDGNHSLATAKTCYENIKKVNNNYLNHPSRYALAEIVNLHSPALSFEAIHRVLFDIDVKDFINELYKYYDINEKGFGQKFEIVTKDYDKILYISNPKSNLSVGSLQLFIDGYLKTHKGKIDYVHGEKITKQLGKKDNNLSIIFDPMLKSELFKTVILDGSLPRKTFSMGHSNDKRYYLESRRLVMKRGN